MVKNMVCLKHSCYDKVWDVRDVLQNFQLKEKIASGIVLTLTSGFCFNSKRKNEIVKNRSTAQKINFSIKDFFSKCDQIEKSLNGKTCCAVKY